MKEMKKKVLAYLLEFPTASDRKLASIIKTSQPTVTRHRNELEKSGFIKSFELIPDLHKLGYEILAIGTADLGPGHQPEFEHAPRIIMACKTMMYHWLVISVHRDYHDYVEFSKRFYIKNATLMLTKDLLRLSFRDLPVLA